MSASTVPESNSTLTWRRMIKTDITNLILVAEKVHPSLPESPEVFTERMTLFPEGCLILTDSDSNSRSDSDPEPRSRKVYGYAISHPIPHNQPPALDSLLGSLPNPAINNTQDHDKEDEDNNNPLPPQYYIHDVAILPEFRGRGLAEDCIRQILNVARSHGYKTTVLISVYGTSQFWERYSFHQPDILDEALREKLKGYGDDAVFLVRAEEL